MPQVGVEPTGIIHRAAQPYRRERLRVVCLDHTKPLRRKYAIHILATQPLTHVY